MRAKWMCAAVAAVMGCGLAGEVQRAEAAPLAVNLTASGQATVKFTTNDPSLRDYEISSKPAILTASLDGSGFYESYPYSSFDLRVGGIDYGTFGDYGNGATAYNFGPEPDIDHIYLYSEYSNYFYENLGAITYGTLNFQSSAPFATDGHSFSYKGGKGIATFIDNQVDAYYDDSNNFIVIYRTTEVDFTFANLAGRISTIDPVPLPASAPLFGAALLALGAIGYASRRGKTKPA